MCCVVLYNCPQLGYRFNCLNTHNYLGVDSIIIYSYKSICISILLGNRSITIQQVKLIKKIKLLLCKIQKHRDVSVILFPLRKLRSTRISDLVFTSAKRLSSSIPLALHFGQQTLDAPECSGIRSAHDPCPRPANCERASVRFPPISRGVRCAHSPA